MLLPLPHEVVVTVALILLVDRVVEEGLVTACSSLCRMEDEATMRACAHLFCHMSLDSNARTRLAEKVRNGPGRYQNECPSAAVGVGKPQTKAVTYHPDGLR